MPFCRYCGHEIRESDQFCFNCGKKVHEEHINEEEKVILKEETPQNNEVIEEKKFDGTGLALGLIAFISSLLYLFPVSIILGAITFPKKRSSVSRGFGVTGFVIGILEVLFVIFVVILFFLSPEINQHINRLLDLLNY